MLTSKILVFTMVSDGLNLVFDVFFGNLILGVGETKVSITLAGMVIGE